MTWILLAAGNLLSAFAFHYKHEQPITLEV